MSTDRWHWDGKRKKWAAYAAASDQVVFADGTRIPNGQEWAACNLPSVLPQPQVPRSACAPFLSMATAKSDEDGVCSGATPRTITQPPVTADLARAPRGGRDNYQATSTRRAEQPDQRQARVPAPGAASTAEAPVTSAEAQEARAAEAYYTWVLKRTGSQRQALNDAVHMLVQLGYDERRARQSLLRRVQSTKSAAEEGVQPAASVKSSKDDSDDSDLSDDDSDSDPGQESSTRSPSSHWKLSDTDELTLFRNPSDEGRLLVTNVNIADGSGSPSQRAEALLDSGATHELISSRAVQRLGFTNRLRRPPSAQHQKVGYLGYSAPVLGAVHLTWQFVGKDAVYSQTFFVVDDLPFDVIIGDQTIRERDLWSQGLEFHEVKGRKIKLNALVLGKKSKGESRLPLKEPR